MLELSPVLDHGRDTDQIRRYFSFSKFVSMLVTGSLYFCRIDELEDRAEGVLPDKMRLYYGDQITEILNKERTRTFVNCWHINELESNLMWRAYSYGEPAVAVESTVKRMQEVLRPLPDQYFPGKVKYIDFNTDQYTPHNVPANCILPVFHKRKFFESESEFRVLLFQASDKATEAGNAEKLGVKVPIDLDKLVCRIRVHAAATPWFKEIVDSVCKKYGLQQDIVSSEL